MNTFSGIDYLKIDIANCYRLDKESWTDRLLWANTHKDEFEDLLEEADDPYMMVKAVIAYRKTMRGEAVGHNMHLDATASGLQIMACLSGCYETAKRVNLINTGNREDVYTAVADEMNIALGLTEPVTRADIKKPLMTHYYCKTVQETLTENQKGAFYGVLAGSFEGAEQVKDLIQSYWNPNVLEHSWSLPDGHKVVCKVKEMIDARIELDELDHKTFTYRFEKNEASMRSSSLAPNVIHSIDGYIVREMVRRAKLSGVQLAHIHDSFCASPKYMNTVRILYKDILCEIADSNLLANILSDISGTKVIIDKTTNNLSKYIRESEYALS